MAIPAAMQRATTTAPAITQSISFLPYSSE
jgi:hypothetical protein